MPDKKGGGGVSLVAVNQTELALGIPFPWAVYDRHRTLLRPRGEIINDEEELQSLLDGRPMRDPDAQPDAALPRSPGDMPEIEVSQSKAPAGSRFTFYDMGLKAGDRIQLAPPPNVGPERHIVKLIGYLDPVSLLVTTPVANGVRVQLLKDDEVVARVFSGRNAFGFASAVTRVCKLPFEYLHLSFPQEIQGAVIRKSPRILLKLIATIATAEQPDAEPASGMIVNISYSGALVDARKPLGEKGQKLQLTFRVTLHNQDVLLKTNAVIRSVFADETPGGSAQTSMLHHGIEFEELQANDDMILHSLIYQHMIEHPNNVI